MNKRFVTAATTFGAAALVFSAAALAQSTPTPAPSVTPGATTSPSITGTITAGTTGTTTVVTTGTLTPGSTGTGTVTVVGTGTAVGTGTVSGTGTAVASGTPSVVGTAIPTIPVPASVYVPGGVGNFPFASAAFERVFNRTDLLVRSGQVKRTYFWGPGPNTPGLIEQYNEGINRQRLVQYFDKSRMELNNPNSDKNNPFFVTNGLLTVELISGFIQVGDKDFVNYRPACIPMSGDFGDTNAPTYFAFQGVSNTQAGDHPAADRTGQNATETIDRDGKVGNDPSKASIPGVNFVHYEATTKHNIPNAFWTFLNSSGPVRNDQGQVVNEQLSQPWFYATGLPISEPYWAKAKIDGQLKDVLIQAYERRALTYVPTNPTGFQVEMANIGQHYFDWRYRNYGYCPQNPVSTPTAPVPAPTSTTASGTPHPTGTSVGTTTPGTTATVSTTTTTTPNTTVTAVTSATPNTTVTVGATITPGASVTVSVSTTVSPVATGTQTIVPTVGTR